MPPLQFAAQAYQARSPQLISQRLVNGFVETAPKDAQSQVPIFGSAGLTLFSRQGSGPINGMNIFQGQLAALSGGALYMIAANGQTPNVFGVPQLVGQTSLGGVCSMAGNGQQLVMVDGEGGWIYQPAGLNQVTTVVGNAGDTSIAANITGTITSGDTLNIPLDNGATFTTTAASTVNGADTSIPLSTGLPSTVSPGAVITDPANVLGPITAPAFMAASTVTFFDSYFVFDARGTREFFISGSSDGTQYSGLDFATASASPRNVTAVRAYHEQLLVFTETTIEVWWDTGSATFPFQRYDAAFIERGTPAPLSVASDDNTVFWMGDDGNFYRLEAFTPQRKSTFATEHQWAQYPARFTDAQAFILEQEGHKFVIVNFPSGNTTWQYDIATNLWSERESWGSPWV